MFGKKKRRSKKQDGSGAGQVDGQDTAAAGDVSAAEAAPPGEPGSSRLSARAAWARSTWPATR